MLKKTVAAVGIAALAGAGALSVLPAATAKAGDMSKGGIQIAACNPCAAKKKAAGGCNPCAAKKKAAGGCNPCAAKKEKAGGCNPCAAKKK